MWIFFGFLWKKKLNISGLWSKQDLWERHLELLETMINIFHHFIDQPTNRLFGKIIDRLIFIENNHKLQPYLDMHLFTTYASIPLWLCVRAEDCADYTEWTLIHLSHCVCVPICMNMCVGVQNRKCKGWGSSLETKAPPHLHISAWVLSFHRRLRLLSLYRLRGNILELQPPPFPSTSIDVLTYRASQTRKT